MVKRSLYAAILALVGMMSMGCDWGWSWGGANSTTWRLIEAWLHEDLFS